MSIKMAILSSLRRDTLKRIIHAFQIRGIDIQNKKKMCEALCDLPGVSAKIILPYLSDAKVQAICKSCGISGKGCREELMELLLQEESRGAGNSFRDNVFSDKGIPLKNRLHPARPESVSLVQPKLANSPDANNCFVAIDFETADYGPDSACSVALVRVLNDQIVDKAHFFIRPPRRTFVFTYLHGISWKHVANEPTFGELWPHITEKLAGAEFIAAHNAAFDRSVFMACCQTAALPPPVLPFQCTVRLARKTWNLRHANLPSVCTYLGIPLKHHDAVSDAEACAGIVIASRLHMNS